MDYINNLEQWMPVREFPNYMVSSSGRVMNIKTFKVLKPATNSYGFLCITLSSNGYKTGKKIHRLVADAFILNSTDLPYVNHKDKNKLNNQLSNLYYHKSFGDMAGFKE